MKCFVIRWLDQAAVHVPVLKSLLSCELRSLLFPCAENLGVFFLPHNLYHLGFLSTADRWAWLYAQEWLVSALPILRCCEAPCPWTGPPGTGDLRGGSVDKVGPNLVSADARN